MRTTATMLLALGGLLICPHALWAGSASSKVTIGVYIEPQAEWALPESPQFAPGLEMDVGEEAELEQLLRAFTNATATLTWTVVRSNASTTQPATNRGDILIDSSHTRVVVPSGPDLVGGIQTKATQVWSGGDTDETHPSAGEIVEIILTLSWP